MRRLILLVVVLSGLVLAPGAEAVQLVNPDGSVAQPYQTWVDRSEMPVPTQQVMISEDASKICGSLVIDYCTTYGTIALRTRCEKLTDRSDAQYCRFMFWHELGHVFTKEMPQWKLDRYAVIMGESWTEPSAITGYSSLFEGLADGYALCKYRRTSVASRFLFSGTPSQVRRTCRLIRQPN